MNKGRPVLALIGFGTAYFIAAATSASMTRFDGGLAFIWSATALLLARLYTVPVSRWASHAAVCALASCLATGFFGLGWTAAPGMAALNVAEALIAAAIMHSTRDNPDLDSLGWLKAFLVAAFSAASCGSLGAASMAWLVAGSDWTGAALNWLIGHTLGLLIFTPLFAQVFSGRFRDWWSEDLRSDPIATIGQLVVMVALTWAAFAQDMLPLLFLPLFPLVLLTYSGGHVGAALGIFILVAIGGAFTINGHGPIQLVGLEFPRKIQFFQAYLAGTVLTVLPLAALQARKQQLFDKLSESEARYRLLADESSDIIITMDLQATIRFVSAAVETISGYAPDEVLGHSPLLFIDREFHDRVRAAHQATLAAGGDTVRVEYLGVTRTGERRWFETAGRAVLDKTGHPTGVVGCVRDIHDRKLIEEKLAVEALTDELTGARNRRAFVARIEDALAAGSAGSVAIVDLDHFKRINDSYGHAAGDAALVAFARIASELLRTDDVLGRIGGEEFALYLAGATIRQAEAVCQRVLDAFAAERFQSVGGSFSVTASCGIALLRDDCSVTMQAADDALYRAKRAGRDRIALAA